MDWQAFWLTIRLAVLVAAVLVVLGLPIAYCIAYSRWRWKFLAEAVVALPIVLPPTVLGFYVLVALGAYLGGDEVYDLGYGVNHTAFQHGPGRFVPVLPESELQPNKPVKADAKGVAVVLVKQDDQVYALDDTCVHAGCSLSGGHLDGPSIICPCHGSQYDLRDGAVINGPATMPEPSYEVRIRNGVIEVKQAG